eukprot:3019344-Karenia_brevis.AAC.1
MYQHGPNIAKFGSNLTPSWQHRSPKMAHDSLKMPHKSTSESKPGSLRPRKRAMIDNAILSLCRAPLSMIAVFLRSQGS